MTTPIPTRCRPARPLLAALAGCGLLWLAAVAPGARAAPAAKHLGVGATFDVLKVGTQVYRHATVWAVNARTIVIAYPGGLASVHLRDLPPELRAAFGYDPRADAAAEAKLDEAQRRAEWQERARELAARVAQAARAAGFSGNPRFERLLQSFNRPPAIRPEVDLRPRFLALGLNVKDQGPHPSCAVFAIVSVLEYENAELTGRPERFSEQYLVWATSKTLDRAARGPDAAPSANPDSGDPDDPGDDGFSLAEVVTALRAYGVPPLAALPYTGSPASDIHPGRAVIAEARAHRRVSIFTLPGRDNAARIANLVHALNAGMPAAVGLRWPQYRTIRSGYLGEQQPLPDNSHAVTIVGYENKTGKIADTVFVFKNSWGIHWGAAGYGYVTYGYLVRNLDATALLEVGPGDASASAPRR